MAQKTIIPTRMELTRLKKRIFTARRGHKLLKDKRDEIMKQFLSLIKITKQLREKIDFSLKKIHHSMINASANMTSGELDVALMFPKERLDVKVDYRSILNLKVPVFTLGKEQIGDNLPYGLALTYIGLDDIMKDLFEVFRNMLKLAENENACRVLSEELQKSNRRVNALEHIVIPQASSAIKNITVKIEEQELSTAIRLLKVKDMMVKKS